MRLYPDDRYNFACLHAVTVIGHDNELYSLYLRTYKLARPLMDSRMNLIAKLLTNKLSDY